jgi:hypothetical protein
MGANFQPLAVEGRSQSHPRVASNAPLDAAGGDFMAQCSQALFIQKTLPCFHDALLLGHSAAGTLYCRDTLHLGHSAPGTWDTLLLGYSAAGTCTLLLGHSAPGTPRS